MEPKCSCSHDPTTGAYHEPAEFGLCCNIILPSVTSLPSGSCSKTFVTWPQWPHVLHNVKDVFINKSFLVPKMFIFFKLCHGNMGCIHYFGRCTKL